MGTLRSDRGGRRGGVIGGIQKNSFQFAPLSARETPSRKAALVAAALCLLGIGYNYLSCGEFLIAYKLRQLNALEFIFQYLWLFCQAALFLLLIARKPAK